MGQVEDFQSKKIRANPIELLILVMISGIFIHSLYQFFYDQPVVNPSALVPMKANPISEGRSPASTQKNLLTLELECAPKGEKITSAQKARLSGRLCGNPSSSGAQLLNASISNLTNQFNATVFAQTDSNQYSTDYIPLAVGKNIIHLEFSFGSDKKFTQDYTIIKN